MRIGTIYVAGCGVIVSSDKYVYDWVWKSGLEAMMSIEGRDSKIRIRMLQGKESRLLSLTLVF